MFQSAQECIKSPGYFIHFARVSEVIDELQIILYLTSRLVTFRVGTYPGRTYSMKLIIFIILLINQIVAYSDSIRVGVLNYAPPFSSKSDTADHYYGFVIDLMNTICLHLHDTCHYVSIPPEGEFHGLNQGMFEVAFTPTPLTNMPSNEYIFSLPYLISNGQFLALKTSSIETIDDINNKKIGFFKFNLEKSPIINRYRFNNQLIEFTDPVELIHALTAEKIDLVFINYYGAKYITNTTGNKLKFIGDKIPIGNGYGIVTLKRHSLIINKINQILMTMEKDGSYLKIYNEYFGFNSTDHHHSR